MTENSDIASRTAAPPEAETDVAAHDQGAAQSEPLTGVLVDKDQPGLPASTLGVTLERLLEPGQRKVGLSVLLQVAASWAKQGDTKFAIVSHQNARLAEDLTKAREENAAHRARNAERDKHGLLVTAALAMGPVLFTMGLNQVQADHGTVGWVLLICGSLIFGAALWTRMGKPS